MTLCFFLNAAYSPKRIKYISTDNLSTCLLQTSHKQMFILDGDRLFLTIHHLSMCSLRHLGVPWHTGHVIQTLEGRMCIHQKMIDSQKVI